MKERQQIALLLVLTSIVTVGALLAITIIPQPGWYTGGTGMGVWTMAAAILAGVTVLQAPLICFQLYRKFRGGEMRRDPDPVLPDHLSFPPVSEGGSGAGSAPTRPWIVNLIFARDPLDFDANGFYATVLDLQRRGILEIIPDRERDGIRVRILNQWAEDPYERQVIGFFREAGPEGFIGRGDLRNPGGNAGMVGRLLHPGLSSRKMVPESGLMRSVADDYLVDGRSRVFPFALNAVILYTGLLCVTAAYLVFSHLLNFTSLILLPWAVVLPVVGGDISRYNGWKRLGVFLLIVGTLIFYLRPDTIFYLLSEETLVYMHSFFLLSLGVILYAIIAGLQKARDEIWKEGGETKVRRIGYLAGMGYGTLLILSLAPATSLLLAFVLITAGLLFALSRYIALRNTRLNLLFLIGTAITGIPVIAILAREDPLVFPALVENPAPFLLAALLFGSLWGLFLYRQTVSLRREALDRPGEGKNIPPKFKAGVALGALACGFLLFLLQLGFSLILLILLAYLAILQFIIALSFPSSLLGGWLEGAYRKKLEWDAFHRMLSDSAMMKKYAPHDLVQWGEWLVYGTALGAGENVTKAMKDLGFEIPTSMIPLEIPPVIGDDFRLARWWNRFWGG